MNQVDYAARRESMVDYQLRLRGITADNVLEAMRRVRREAFVPPNLRELAYDDSPLPIGEGQTISQPYIVALMVESLGLTGGERVLDVGTGSGYAAAVLACIAGEVYSIERIAELAGRAREVLASEGFDNVRVRVGDGTRGWPEQAPFDAISVAACGADVPDALKRQLKINGRMVIPIGAYHYVQELVCITRISDGEYRSHRLIDVRFVPLVGGEDEPEDESPPGIGL